ncbi:MAG TPA: hypothetical protein DCL73_14265 [Treponema sp.]|nr:hypothetical protein [Treponema sp.]
MTIDSSGLDFGLAKTFGKNYMALSYAGNLWTTKDSTNQLFFLFGTGNMGFKAGMYWYVNTEVADTTISTINPYIQWGLNFNAGKLPAALDVFALCAFNNENIDTTTDGASGYVAKSGTTNPRFGANLQLTLSEKDSVSQFVKFGFSSRINNENSLSYTVYDAGGDVDDAASYTKSGSTTGTVEIISAQYRILAKMGDSFTYCGKFTVPFTFTTYNSNSDANSTEIDFVLRNGIQGYIVPKKFALNGGLCTTIPNIYLEKDNSSSGTFTNKLYCGFTWNLSPSFTLEAANEFLHTNTGTGTTTSTTSPSISDFWNEQFTISAIAHF